MKCDLCGNDAQLHMTTIVTVAKEDGTHVREKREEHHCIDHPFTGHEQEAADIKAFERWILDYPKWMEECNKQHGPPFIIIVSQTFQAGVKYGRANP